MKKIGRMTILNQAKNIGRLTTMRNDWLWKTVMQHKGYQIQTNVHADIAEDYGYRLEPGLPNVENDYPTVADAVAAIDKGGVLVMDHVVNSLREWLRIYESDPIGERDENAIRCIKKALEDLEAYTGYSNV